MHACNPNLSISRLLFLDDIIVTFSRATHSRVLIADAGHSFSDLISDFITLWSVRIARLPPDDDHRK